jgi:mannose-6-phosphate isomerase
LEQSLETIDYQRGPIEPQPRREIGGELERLVDCDNFVLDRLEFSSPETIGGDGRYHVVAVIEGEVEAERDAAATTLRLGNTALAPAAAGTIELRPHGKAVILDIFER